MCTTHSVTQNWGYIYNDQLEVQLVVTKEWGLMIGLLLLFDRPNTPVIGSYKPWSNQQKLFIIGSSPYND